MTLRAALGAALLGCLFVFGSCNSTDATGRLVGARPVQAVSLIQSGDYVILDLRGRRAYEAGHVTGAVDVPVREGRVPPALARLDHGRKYLIYARDARTSAAVGDEMVAQGFDYVVDGGSFGMLALAGAPVEQ